MKILIDTHIFLWMLSCPEKINNKRRYELESPANEVLLSAMSIAELMIKSSIGKINIEFDPLEMTKIMQIDVLDFSGIHAVALGKLPFHHKDPFDRMIIVQALVNKVALMSDDSRFLKYNCKII
ncbi:MAG: type II toxin-antitoxin system VapC family toxin [Desulfobacula sp.]|uniref:type II toxin-antitoxin system VapC family toxin n=1 Tax=Desulfobacula sp. TaxID=2593537 RepID=UPI001DB7BC80|nr:type II toxin-antitoxin system VapC family toxin [Desulfobacula sp.]MBT3486432.1 type II toxin-antitoxin system VapC family toxin [Desulfobacula sp.]MBT3805053.1 type II toxin-antitoxin system VapC family toxin [Desulfobacula sp.]MBT4025555.1 type II toxin-antitoxin system VapC family toxin [Desulfobacula sp.]MBT4199717.1 type II toxin-antitoxin system VapC family toxin [Desulfobacula sp.]